MSSVRNLHTAVMGVTKNNAVDQELTGSTKKSVGKYAVSTHQGVDMVTNVPNDPL